MSRENNHKPNVNLIPDTPYKGLEFYSEAEVDANFFFGRESEWEIIADNLMAARLTLLCGASGVGKSSLLRAGVVYHLLQDAKKNIAEYGTPEFAVVVFNAWQYDPLAGLVKQVEKDITSLLGGKTFPPLSSSLELDQILEKWAERLDEHDSGGELLIILDQFEEYFLYHPNEQETGTFAAQFPHAVNRPDLPVNFLISIREDSLAKLDRFKASIPNLFNNYLRVKHLDAKSAYKAIVKPIEKFDSSGNRLVIFALCLLIQRGLHRLASILIQYYPIEEDLVKVVIDQVSKIVKGNNGRGLTKQYKVELEKKIEAPYLQLVMEFLWKEEIYNRHSINLRLKTLEEIGGAEEIVKAHLDRQMKLLRKEEGKVSVLTVAKIFQYLVTPFGSKIAYPLKDLIKHTEWSEDQLRKLLYKLTSEKYRLLRLISESSETDSERYEIFHDVLAQPILDWRKDYLVNEEKEQRNLAIKQGLPAQCLRQLKLGHDRRAALLARQAYRFYQREPNKFKILYQIDDALRAALSIDNFSNNLRGHEKGLYGLSAVAFNPQNSQMLASADGNGIVRLWDLRRSPDARPPLTLEHKHNGGVNALVFSPDGKMLASGSKDGIVELWNLDELDLPCRIVDHKIVGLHAQSVTSVAFNYDGTILASGSKDGNIQLWNPNNPSENNPLTEQPLRDADTVVRAVAFCPNEKNGYLLASGSEDERVRLWDIHQPDRPLKVLEGHSDFVRSVAFCLNDQNPDAKWLASGSDDKTVKLWDIRDIENLDIKLIKTLEDHKDHVWSVAFSPDGQWLASGSEDQTAYLWKLNQLDQQPTRLNLGHDFGISAVAFSPDNQILASGSWDKTIRLWHLEPSEAVPQIMGEHDDNIMSVAVSPDGRWLASGSWDNKVRLWDISQSNRRPKLVKEYKHGNKVFAVAFDQNSQMLASAGADTIIQLWSNLHKSEQKREILTGHTDGVSSVAFSPDGRWLVSGSWKNDATVKLWDLKNPDTNGNIIGKILWQHKNLKTNTNESVTSVAFSPDGQMIASGSDDKTIRLLDLRRTEGLSWESIYEKSSSNSPENPVVDPLVLTGHEARVWSVAFSPNSQILASGSDDQTIRLWDFSRNNNNVPIIWLLLREFDCMAGILFLRALIKVLEGHNFWVGSVAFSLDGQKLASGSYDKTIRIWDLNHLDKESIVLRGHKQSVTSVAFYPDSKKLVSGSYDNTIQEWIVDTGILADMVCKKVQRNLSQKEWNWFMEADIPYERTCPNLPPGEGISEKIAGAEEISELEREFRVKLSQIKLYPGQKYILEFIKRKTTQQPDISEEDVTNFLNKPKGDAGTFYRLETLRLLGFLEIKDRGHGPGTIRYGLSPKYREYLSKTKAQHSK